MNTIRKFYDLAYGDHERQIYDLALPAEGCGGLILFLHGGAWIHGNKDYYRDEFDEWCGKGFAAAAINCNQGDLQSCDIGMRANFRHFFLK